MNGNLNVKNLETKENWYNLETAKKTEDPEVLVKILQKRKDDRVSWLAARNPNCPSETLAEILRENKQDWVSYHAAGNLNSPKEVLNEVVRRGKRDNVSCRALSNLNCSSKTLAEVLKRGENDIVSWCAINNPNCPPKAILEWYEATNQLTKYNPEIHELEKTPIDKDLEELRKLL